MRNIDINELLDSTVTLISELEKETKDSANDQSRLELQKPKVKNCLENLRSCLDYSANDIYDNLKPKLTTNKKKNAKVYFPYNTDQKLFRKNINFNFPDLNAHFPLIYNLIESIQPFKINDSWLFDLCNQTNNIKHKELTKQTREEFKNVKVFGGLIDVTGKDIEISGNTLNGVRQSKDVIIKDSEVKSMIDGSEIDIIITSKVEFLFKDTDINVLKLINKAHKEITLFTSELYKML